MTIKDPGLWLLVPLREQSVLLLALAGAALTPVLERASVYLDKRLFQQRMVNAAEILADAAQAAGVEEDEFEMFVEKLVRDEQHQKLLARVLSAAQDSATSGEPSAESWPTQPMRPGPRSTANSLTPASSPISTLSMSASCES